MLTIPPPPLSVLKIPFCVFSSSKGTEDSVQLKLCVISTPRVWSG